MAEGRKRLVEVVSKRLLEDGKEWNTGAREWVDDETWDRWVGNGWAFDVETGEQHERIPGVAKATPNPLIHEKTRG